jgi:hypothetical protein
LPEDATQGPGVRMPLGLIALDADVLAPAGDETVVTGPVEVRRDVSHREPFQSRATGPAPPELLTPPTTMHAVGEVHDTPLKPLEKPSKHFKSEIDQRLPFQRSATETSA